jgi:benzoyl-CoA reductase subunit D
MITAGLDIGFKTVKIVIVKEDHLIGQSLFPATYTLQDSLKKAWEEILLKIECPPDRITGILATGVGKKEAFMAQERISEVSAAAKGAHFLEPGVRTVIDVGAEEGRVIQINKEGKVVDFAINEKCAAGTGAFTEAMARALEIPLEDLGSLSLRSTQDIRINAQCVVFAESELVSLIHAQTPKADIAKAVHEAIADRIISLVRRVGLEEKVMLIGGLAKNSGFSAALQKELSADLIIPEDPEFISALGAALLAGEL